MFSIYIHIYIYDYMVGGDLVEVDDVKGGELLVLLQLRPVHAQPDPPAFAFRVQKSDSDK